MHILTAPALLAEYSADTWSDVGFVDCAGISCNNPACAAPTNQRTLRVNSAQATQDYCYPNVCQRQAQREWIEFGLSRLSQPYMFTLSGNTSVTTSSRLLTNPTHYDALFNLPEEQFSVSRSDTFARTVPADFQTPLFTKGTLP